MIADDVRIYRFGDFTLETHNYCLKKGRQQIHLRPKAFETLQFLVERQGRLVKKDELLDCCSAPAQSQSAQNLIRAIRA